MDAKYNFFINRNEKKKACNMPYCKHFLSNCILVFTSAYWSSGTPSRQTLHTHHSTVFNTVMVKLFSCCCENAFYPNFATTKL